MGSPCEPGAPSAWGNPEVVLAPSGRGFPANLDTSVAVRSSVILGRGEHLIGSGGASLARGPEGVPGILYLTSTRIVFEAGAGGPTPFTAYEKGLDSVRNVLPGVASRFRSGKREFLTIEDEQGRAIFRVTDAQVWVDAIVAAKSVLPPLPPSTPSESVPPSSRGYAGQAPVIVNVQAPPAPQIMMHCRHCGNLYDATKGRCDKCGAPPT